MFKATKVMKQMLQGNLVDVFSQLTVKGKSTTVAFCKHSYKHDLKEQIKENYPSRFFIKDKNLKNFPHL